MSEDFSIRPGMSDGGGPGPRPGVLIVAGFDQCGGAGILADVKTCEAHGVYAYAVCTALTFQHERIISRIQWIPEKDIFSQIDLCFESSCFEWVKIGITQSMGMTLSIIRHLRQHNAGIKIILDPVIRASSGREFWEGGCAGKEHADLGSLAEQVWLLTPNWEEIGWLCPGQDPVTSCGRLSAHCNIYLKGGHHPSAPGRDYLWSDRKLKILDPVSGPGAVYPKHGSGCVLASSLTANLALGYELPIAADRAKRYIEQFLSSNNTLLGWHQPLEN
jgi:hydroxymethylpyrimidine/phosphomethylpyrimidine kinase